MTGNVSVDLDFACFNQIFKVTRGAFDSEQKQNYGAIKQW